MCPNNGLDATFHTFSGTRSLFKEIQKWLQIFMTIIIYNTYAHVKRLIYS